ncbi:MAG: TRAP transporter substrate-binding protein [Dehalobacterium sp.]
MKKFWKIGLFLGMFLIVSLMAACSSSSPSSEPAKDNDQAGEEKYTIKIAHVMDENHHYQAGAEKFKELVEAKTNGRAKVDIYPSSQLGAERAILEGMQMGTIEMGIVTSGALSGFVPEFGVLDLGYLFKDNKQAVQVLSGTVGGKLSEKMAEKGIRNLGFIDCGFRSFYGKRPITKPEDFKGIKVRVMENPAHQALFSALGASPVPMAFNELYTGLQQGTVDGAENVIDVYDSTKHYEVAKEFSETNHVYLIVMFMISDKVYQSLPADIQEAIASAAKEAIPYEETVYQKNCDDAVAKLKEAGATINVIPDLTPFQNKAKAGWKAVAEKIPGGEELFNEVLNATGQTI